MAETKKQRYQKLLAQCRTERSSFEPLWRDLANFQKPKRLRLNKTDSNRGDRRNQNILDSTATLAANVARAGLTSGMTSSARPWFRFSTQDPDLEKFGPVKNYLEQVRLTLASTLLRSNFYNQIPLIWGDGVTFGTACMAMMDDPSDIFRFTAFPLGEYYLANDDKLRVRVFIREFRMTVRQLVQAFGRIEDGKPDWSVFSPTVKNAWERGNYEQWIDVCHVIQPNVEQDRSRLYAKYKPFADCYYEANANENVYLRESGFDEFPIMAFRWEVAAGDVYGTDCPGIASLGDVKGLQQGEKISLNAIDKMVRPPMIAPEGARATRLSQLAGDVSYYGEGTTDKLIRPLVDTSSFRVDLLELKHQQLRERINQAHFVDLFRLMSNIDPKDVTATAINEMKEEKLLMLGPVFGQADQDVLKPLIDLGYAKLYHAGLLPEAPPELEGHVLEVEYISAMAQALKAIGRSGVDAFTGYTLQIAQVDPSVMDKFNSDKALENYADMTGVPPDMVRSDDDVGAIRQQKADVAKGQAAMQALTAGAGAAKDLSGASLDGNNALSALVGGAGG